MQNKKDVISSLGLRPKEMKDYHILGKWHLSPKTGSRERAVNGPGYGLRHLAADSDQHTLNICQVSLVWACQSWDCDLDSASQSRLKLNPKYAHRQHKEWWENLEPPHPPRVTTHEHEGHCAPLGKTCREWMRLCGKLKQSRKILP